MVGARLALAAAATAAAAGLAPPAARGVHPLGRIVIPAIGLNTVFYDGQAAADTAHGPSHYPTTAMPGEGRTVGIAGHRVTHTHPFLLLGELQPGNLVVVHWGRRDRHAACYRVRRMFVVEPSDVRVLRNLGVDRLVLTTCTPPGYATYRLVVTARRGAC